MIPVEGTSSYCGFGHLIYSARALSFASALGINTSALPVVALVEASDPPGVLSDKQTARWHVLHEIEDYPGGPILRVRCDGDHLLIQYAGWDAYMTRGEAQLTLVQTDNHPEVAFEHIAERVWVPLFALWTQPEWLALHGSAVARGLRCLVLLGQSGAGKSTTAYTLYQKGAALVSDDMVLIDPMEGVVYSAAPTVRLWQGADVEGAIRQASISPVTSKRWYAMRPDVRWRVSWPLAQLVVLVRDAEAPRTGVFHSMGGIERAVVMLENSFDWSNPTPDLSRARLQKVLTLQKHHAPMGLFFSSASSGQPEHLVALSEWSG